MTPQWPIRLSVDYILEEAWYLLYYTATSEESSALLLRVRPNFEVTLFYEIAGERKKFVPFEEGTFKAVDAALTDFQNVMERGTEHE